MLDDEDTITFLSERFGEDFGEERLGEGGFLSLMRFGDVVEVGKSKTRIAADGGSLGKFFS